MLVCVSVWVGVCANRRPACGTAWECSDLVFVVEMRPGHRAKLYCSFPLGHRGDGPGEHAQKNQNTNKPEEMK